MCIRIFDKNRAIFGSWQKSINSFNRYGTYLLLIKNLPIMNKASIDQTIQIELVNISYQLSFYDNYPSFEADLVINDRLSGKVTNEGFGNACDYTSIDEVGQELIHRAEQYCSTLPPMEYAQVDQEEDVMLQSTLRIMLDDLFEQHLIHSQHLDFEKTVRRQMHKEIIYGYPERKILCSYGFSIPLSRILANPLGAQVIINALRTHILPKFESGMVVLNDNIPEDIYISAGFVEGQYPQSTQKVSI